jgi:hypothetical protein
MKTLFTFLIIPLGLFSPPLSAEKSPACPASASSELCEHGLDVLSNAAERDPKDADEALNFIIEELEKKLKEKEFVAVAMESPFLKGKLDVLPFDTTFKVIDLEEGDSVLALDFGYRHEFSNNTYAQEGKRSKSYKFDFDLRGTATQNDEENPRNFIESSLSFAFSSRPNFTDKAILSTLLDMDRVKECTTDRDLQNDKECILLEKLAIDASMESAGFTYFMDYGVDIGYETDQSFNASNTTLSLFGRVTLKDYRNKTFMGLSGIIPTVRLAIESVDPSAETPRAITGDDSDYERFTAEFHVDVPLIELMNIAYTFSFNYRSFSEFGASDIVKDVNLDRYHLRTFSLSAPAGLAISYSSGRLPFGLEEQQTIELGFKTYF